MGLEDIEKEIEAFRNARSPKKIKKKSKQELPQEHDNGDTASEYDGVESFVMAKKKKKHESDSPRWLKRTLLIGASIGLLVIALGALFIFTYLGEPRGISADIYAAQTVTRGVPFDVSVNVTNNANMPLQNGSITLNLPNGLVALNTADPSVVSEKLGDVKSGSLTKRTYTLLPVGAVGNDEKIMVTFAYEVGGGSRFETDASQDVTVQDAAVLITAKTPNQVLAGSTFSFDLSYANTSDMDIQNATLEADYPDGFKFDSASVTPSSFTNYWDLGTLPAHTTSTITITGRFSDTSQSGVSIPVKIATTIDGQDRTIADGTVQITPSPSPLGLTVLINGQDGYVARVGDTLQYAVRYQNLSGIALSNLTIRVALTGDLLDFTTLGTTGVYSPSSQTVTWSSANIPALALVSPGGSGEVDFTIGLKNQFNLQRLNDKNYYVRSDVQANSPSVPYYLSSSNTSAEVITDTKVSGAIAIAARAYYRDALSQIANAGNLPPKAGQATQFTVHWLLSDYANDTNNIEVRAALPAGVKWTGTVKSNGDTSPQYDASSGSVVWDIPKMTANRGVLTDPLEAVFQVEATPDASGVGQYETILEKTQATATDSFTGATLTDSADPLTTALPLDDTVSPAQGIVVQ